MEMKKVISAVLIAIVVASILAICADAIDTVDIEQVFPYVPEMTVAFRTDSTEEITKDDCFTKLGNGSLDIEKVEKYDASKYSSTIYFLVDISNSVDKGYFDSTKKKMIEYSDSLPENDRIVLLSFGKKVNVMLNGSENSEKRRQVISSLARTDTETNLYNAIRKAVDLSQSDTLKKCDRSFAIVVSDGENFETSGGSTEQEVRESLSGHGLPIYAFCVGGNRENASNFGSFSRSSGGEIVTVNSVSSVSRSFDALVQKTKNIYIITARSKDNKPSDGSQKNLMLRVKDKSTSLNVKFVRWIKDDEQPTVINAETRENRDGQECLYIYYSENVFNADNPANFSLTRENGKVISFKTAEYCFEDGEYYSVLVPKKTIAKHDDYTLNFINITDSSNEQNELKSSGEKYNLGSKNSAIILLQGYWWVLIIAAAAAGVVVLLIFYKKSKANESSQMDSIQNISAPIVSQNINDYRYDMNHPVEKHHVVTPDGKKITLKISNGKSVVRTVDITVYGSITVGRSDSCDIYFDDLKMSRKHFEIQREGDDLWIKDLGSANGTILNNIKINGKRKLLCNDAIIAGQQTMIIIF